MEQGNDQNGKPDRSATIIAAGMLLSAMVMSWSLRDDGPRYQLAGSGSSVVRMDSDSGAMIACDKAGCSPIQLPDRAKTFGPLRVEFGGDTARQVDRDVQRQIEQETRQAVEKNESR